MRASDLHKGDKFILPFNGKKYKHCGDFFVEGMGYHRIKVKAVGHQESPTVGKDMTKITVAKNAIVILV